MSLLKEAKLLLEKYRTRPIKSLGQNFLINEHVLDKIVAAADLQQEEFVIEIGPGLGFLTRKLADATKKVLVVDLDSKMVEVLKEEMPPYVTIVHGDALKIDWKSQLKAIGWNGQPVKVAANLPYYITTPILFMFLEGDLPISQMVMMMQKEVAERIKANPGGKEYGALSVAVQYRCEVEQVCNVSAASFLPQPDVESTVVKFIFRQHKKAVPKDESLFLRAVKAAFSQRRKTLRNTLGATFTELKQDLPEILSSIGINSDRRGETLSVEEFVAVSDALFEKLNN